jgi:hypothetical protein
MCPNIKLQSGLWGCPPDGMWFSQGQNEFDPLDQSPSCLLVKISVRKKDKLENVYLELIKHTASKLQILISDDENYLDAGRSRKT